MDGVRLIRLEADENEDGKIDRWEFYPAVAVCRRRCNAIPREDRARDPP